MRKSPPAQRRACHSSEDLWERTQQSQDRWGWKSRGECRMDLVVRSCWRREETSSYVHKTEECSRWWCVERSSSASSSWDHSNDCRTPHHAGQSVRYLSWFNNVCLTLFRILLAVLKPWKKILESTHKLWTTLDTSNVKKPISYKSLKIHLRRSNYTLEQAIIKKGTGIEAERLELLTKNCKKLRELHFIGSGSIGDSLVQSIRHAHNLESLAVGRGLQITLSAVQAILSDCKEHVINATFLNVKGNHLRFVPDRWPRMDSLTTIHLRGDKNSVMDIVSVILLLITTSLKHTVARSLYGNSKC